MQKNALRIILKKEYCTYSKALTRLGMEQLGTRRDKLVLNFAQKCVKNPKTSNMFPLNSKLHNMYTRNQEKYFVQKAHIDRLKNHPSYICRIC